MSQSSGLGGDNSCIEGVSSLPALESMLAYLHESEDMTLATWVRRSLEADLTDLVRAEVQCQSVQSLNSPEKIKLIAPAILSKARPTLTELTWKL